ncbi:LOW QUALITY PROTEIN: uncharacterized protein [Rutidosis leptorrhynchoides]|uniref:LOW QUALITY PROTEIN: uncharacterized protein n=1 Tax=Rutidosis leptorrhynchoides TaxID=125765 RepID=UPI003A98EF2F
MNHVSALSPQWVHDSPILSDVDAKLRRLLVELGTVGRIIGIQVCAYKDGKVIIDTAAGVLGKDDPRPVQNDSLFPVFSVTKGVTAGIVHWLADNGKLKLDENVANIWPEFGKNGKDQIQVNHVLNHTAGLHNALANLTKDPQSYCDWDECLKRIVMVATETEPGHQQLYHYLSYGWLCGGIIEHATGKKFHDILKDAFSCPLNVEDEFYIGIPPGVESRVATVTMDPSDLDMVPIFLADTSSSPMPFPLSPASFEEASRIISLTNELNVRRAKIPAANGHFSARALARFYAALVDGGVVPLPHPLTTMKTNETIDISDDVDTKIFTKTKVDIHDAFLGSGDYKDLIFPNKRFGLGFGRFNAVDGSVIGFGVVGLGGSVGYCDISNRFAISVTLNKLTLGGFTGEIIRFVCSELDLPVPADYAESTKKLLETPVIN